MDKPMRPIADIEPPNALLKRAMANLLAVEAPDVLRQASTRIRSSRFRSGNKTPGARWPGGLHRHPYPEICIPLTRNAILDLADAQLSFHPPALAVLEPQSMHCEAFCRESGSYQVLWMSFSGSSVLAAVSRYRARRNWDSPYRWAMQHPAGRRAFKRLAQPDPDSNNLEPLRADLLQILSDLLMRSLLSEPDGSPGLRRAERHRHLLEGVKTFIENHLDGATSAPLLAASVGLTPNYLNFLFKKWHGEPIHTYVLRRRMEVAMELCQQGDLLVKQIALRVGYDDPLYFSRAFRRFHGTSPAQVRVHN